MTDVVAITTERRKTHGDWIAQAALAYCLKRDFRCSEKWHALPPWKQEALDMIAVKLSRILVGNANEPDHWDDIAGYAHLGKGGHGVGEAGEGEKGNEPT